jgi:hypothetical protein
MAPMSNAEKQRRYRERYKAKLQDSEAQYVAVTTALANLLQTLADDPPRNENARLRDISLNAIRALLDTDPLLDDAMRGKLLAVQKKIEERNR